MRLIIYALLVLSLSCYFGSLMAATVHRRPTGAPSRPLQPPSRQAKPIRVVRSTNEDETANEPAHPSVDEHPVSSRLGRCARWLYRTANRYIRPGGLTNLLGGSGSFFNINVPVRPIIRISSGYTENRAELPNYPSQPESGDRENNAYYVPSASPAPAFVETSNFATPPNRVAPASSASPAIETNDDWVHNAEPESPPAREESPPSRPAVDAQAAPPASNDSAGSSA